MKGRFVIFSEPRSIEVVDQIMLWVAGLGEVSESVLFAVRLALTEAIINAILHGNEANPEKRVVIDLETKYDSLYCCVSDEGKGFVMESVQDPRDLHNREKEGGRGVLFIQEVTEHFVYCNESRAAKFSIKLK